MPADSGTLRIIGGCWRRRQITFDASSSIRPTPDRIRETVFNWLSPMIHQSTCLDCFAGSGAMGFEALSRGAKHVTFIDASLSHLRGIDMNANKLTCDAYSTELATIPSQVLPLSHAPFDIVFLDPPFHQDLLQPSLLWLAQSSLITSTSYVYFEVEKNLDIAFLEDVASLVKLSKTKSIQYGLLSSIGIPNP